MVKWIRKGLLYVAVFFAFLSLSDLIVPHLEKREDLHIIGLLAGFASGLIQGLRPKGVLTFGASFFLMHIAILPAILHMGRGEDLPAAMAFAGATVSLLLGVRFGKRLKSPPREEGTCQGRTD